VGGLSRSRCESIRHVTARADATEQANREIAKVIRATTGISGISVSDIQKYGALGVANSFFRSHLSLKCEHVIALDGVAIIVNPATPCRSKESIASEEYLLSSCLYV
jgi:hypothetical protein